MAEQFLMPKLGLTMESGKIVRWLVAEGSDVSTGQSLLLIETDKVESEVESTGEGRLTQVGRVGEEYPCGQNIGWLLAPGEEAPAVPVPVVSRPAGGRILASPNARRVAAERGVDLHVVSGTGPGGRITSEDVPAALATGLPPVAPRPASVGSDRPATAAARNLANLLGIDLGLVAPLGTDPRVTKEDVAAHVRGLLAERGADTTRVGRTRSAPSKATALLQEPVSVLPLRGMRGTIADRVFDSLHSMAQLTLSMDVDMDAVVADRAVRAEAGAAPGYTDYVIAATAAALSEHPKVNSQLTEDGVALLPKVHVGMAVALDDGLIVPVIRDTANLDLDRLSGETSRLAAAARNGELKLHDLEGGTFSVTALGMYDVDGFTPIINAPNTAILGIGRLRDDVAWSEDGSPTRTTRLTLSLTWDHRAFDGAPAAEFTRSIKHHLEAVGVER